VLLFLDDDIRINSDFLAAHSETMTRSGAPMVSGQILEDEAHTVDNLPIKACDPDIGWLYFRKNYSKECRTTFMMSGNCAIRRDLFLQLRGMDENYEKGAFREESDFALRLAGAGHVGVFQPRASIYHLGSAGAPDGGARNTTKNKSIAGFHHCVGDWYFNLRFARGRLMMPLFEMSIRHFIFNRYNVRHPWLLPILLGRWLVALPVALAKRLRGPKTLSTVPTS
jgi:GT2 family glycosyltransferase